MDAGNGCAVMEEGERGKTPGARLLVLDLGLDCGARQYSGSSGGEEGFSFPLAPFLFPLTTLGDSSEGVPPVPIPNTAVKPLSPDGTARASVWESRKLPN